MGTATILFVRNYNDINNLRESLWQSPGMDPPNY